MRVIRKLSLSHASRLVQLRRLSNTTSPLDPQAQSTSRSTSSSINPFTTSRLLALAKPQSSLLAGAFGTLTITSSVTLAFPYICGRIIDAAVLDQSSVDPTVATASLFGLIMTAGAGVVARQILLTIAGENIVSDLRADLFRSILRQESSFYDKTRTGDLITRLTSDVQLVQAALTTEVLNGARAIIMTSGGIGFLLYTSPSLTMVSLLSLPPIFVSAKYFGAQIKALQKDVQTDLARTTTKAEEVISNIRTVRSFNAEKIEAALYAERTVQVRDRAVAAGLKGAFLDGSVHVAANAGLLAILGVGGTMIGVGGGESHISPGELASFLMYSIFVAGNVSALSTVYGGLQKSSGAAQRIFSVIDRQPEITSPTAPQLIESETPLSIKFTGVDFAYPSRPKFPVLTNFSVDFLAGSHTALVGSSGSGKSTVASILLRLYDVSRGSIEVGGIALTDVDLVDLRDKISVVQQEPVLFSESIEANIRYGRPNASDAEVLAAAKAAKVLDFTDNFPDGISTAVGEKGVQLSGGQKQRVAVARVLLRNSPIVIFDEATSALDAESEHAVTLAIESLVKGRTVVSIAHRLSTIRKADRIVVMDKGRVVQVGDTQELLKTKGGAFGELIKRQRVESGS